MLIRFILCVCLMILDAGFGSAASYGGCYRERKQKRYFGVSPGGYDPTNLNIAKCQELCRAYKYEYAGLTSNKDSTMGFCFCGNDLPPGDTQENDAFCNNPCSDGSQDLCGGFDHVAVHKTGIPITGLTLSSDAPTGVAEIFKPVKFDYSIVEGPVSVLYQIAFGDGADTSVGNATNMDTKIFSLPGEYIVTLHVSDADIPALSGKYSVRMLSQSPVNTITLQCPEFVITYEEFKCNASVVGGSYMQVTLSWKDDSSDTFPISDSMLHAAGLAVPNAEIANIGNLGSAVSNIILLPSSEFQQEGLLLGFEFFTYNAGSTTGTIEIYVLAPDCSGASSTYCHQTRSCSAGCGVYGQASCTTYCISKGGCVENTCTATSRSMSAYPEFTVVEVFSVTSSILNGYEKYLLNSVEQIQVQPGYILGYKSLGDTKIATRPLDGSGELSDFDSGSSVGNAGNLPNTGTAVNGRHLLRAIAARPSWVLFYHEYFEAGQYELTVNVSTDLIDSTAEDTFTLTVLEGISFVIIESPEFSVTGEEVTFTILPHTGTNVSYEWTWGDTLVNNSEVLTFTHMYTQPGIYNVTVVASNPLTSKENTTTITIQDPVINVEVVSAVAEVNSPHPLVFSADSGTDYTCMWLVASSPPQTFTTNDTTSPITGSDVTHTFTSDGHFSVSVNCSNDVSQNVFDFIQKVEYAIVGLDVEPKGAIVGTVFNIEWSIVQGTDVSFEVTFNGGVVSHQPVDSLNARSETMSGLPAGVYPLTVYAENNVSNDTQQLNFTVEEKITGQGVEVDTSEISKGDSVTFTVSAESGTSIEILLDYKDGSNDTFYKGLLVAWMPGEKHIQTHTFTTGGEFSVEITIKNNFDTFTFTKEIIVYNSVAGSTLHASPPVEYLGNPTDMAVWFQALEAPTRATAVIDWGDDSGPQTFPNIQLEPTKYSHTYTAEGSYTVRATVSNAVSDISLTTVVHLVVPVVNLVLRTTPEHGSVSEDVQLDILMDQGPGVNLTLDWGENAPLSWQREGTTSWEFDRRTHVYNAVGNYTITVTATNLLGVTTKTYSIAVQNPVVENFTLSTAPSLEVYDPAGLNTRSVTLTFPDSLTLPDSATVTVDYGDGTQSSMPLPFNAGVTPYTYTVAKDFSTAGLHTVTFTIQNLASTVVVEIQVGVYEMISGLDGDATYMKYEPYDSKLYSGLGNEQNSFPFGKDVIFNVTLDEGTVAKWMISMVESEATAIQMCDFSSDQPLAVSFIQPGIWNVNVTAWNEIGNESKIFSLNIFQPPVHLVLTDEGTSKVNQPKNIGLSFDDIGGDVCVVIDWGDNSKSLYANNSECENMSDLNITGTIHRMMSISRQYTTEGLFQVTANASTINPSVSVVDSIQFWVSQTDCNAPALQIKDHSPEGSVPREEKKSHAFHVIAETELSCSVTLQNHKIWTVEKMKPDRTVKEVIDISQLYSKTNAELAISERFLDYGLYRFTYKVSMDTSFFPNNEEYSSEIETYIKIVESEVIAGLQHSGISFIQRGNEDLVELDAGNNSYDPDMDPNVDQEFTSFEWLCQDLEDPEPIDWTNSFPAPKEPDPAQNPDKGGCFGHGPGTINTTASKLRFRTDTMLINHTYKFTTTVYKSHRNATTELLLKIVQGSPPAIEIECSNNGFCQQVSNGLKVNLGRRVKLKAACTECDLDSLSLKWMMERQGLVDSWIAVNDLSRYIQGLESKEIAISVELFEEGFQLYDNMTTYRVTLFASDGMSEGSVYTNLHMNRGPSPGNCSVSPNHGTVFTEKFNISCTKWYDPDGISSYQFFATYKGVFTEKHLSFTETPELITTLPEGPQFDNYRMTIWVRVADRMGSITKMEIGVVQVYPKNESQVRAEINELVRVLETNPSNSSLEIAVANGNLRAANLLFQEIGSALNLERNYDKSSYKQLEVVSDKTATEYDTYSQNNVTSQTIHQKENLNEEEMKIYKEEYEAERNQRAELRERMIVSLENLTIEDVGDILFTASTLTVLTTSPEELSREAESSVVYTLDEMTRKLEVKAKDTSIEELRQVTGMMAEVVGETLEGANINIEYPVESDLEDAVLSPYYYYDTDLNSERKGFFGEPLDNAEDGLTHETNAIVQTDKMKVMVPDGLNVVQRAGHMLSLAMVSGENATNIITPKLSLTVAKDAAETILSQHHVEGEGSFFLPNWCSMLPAKQNCSNKEKVSLVSIATPSNIFQHLGNGQSVLGYSSTLTLELYDEEGELVKITNSTEPIHITIPRDPKLDDTELKEFDEQAKEASKDLFYHKFNVSDHGASLHIEVKPSDESVQYLVLVRKGDFPRLNATVHEWDFLGLVPHNMSAVTNVSEIDHYTVFIDNTQVRDFIGTVYVGIKQLTPAEHDLYSDANPPHDAPHSSFTSSYSMQTWTSGCYFERDGYWQDEGCTVQPTTTYSETQCQCNHLTSFAAGFMVKPNTIDFDFVFSNLDFHKNPTLYITQILVAVIYLAFAIWARREDKKDLEKLGVSPLMDNDPKDKYLYEVQVCTGSRKNAATDSKVNMIFSGEYDETDVRPFDDVKRKIFRRGTTDNFLMAVSGPLGPIQYVRIWHDNSGKGKFQGWYCRHIIVHDLQTKEKFFFIVNKWFAVEEDDGQIDRLFPVAGPENLIEFDVLFSQKTRKNLSDEHLWFSVIARPPQSRFTRLQRVSCCLCLLFTSMLASAMFYQQTSAGAARNTLVIGPFALTPEQIYVGIISNLIVFPVNMLIVTLFRKSRPRKKRKSRIEEALKQYQKKARVNSAASDNDKRQLVQDQTLDPQFSSIESRSSTPKLSPAQPLQPAHQPNMTTLNMDSFNKTHRKDTPALQKQKKSLSFPWWCQIVAWVLLWLVTLASAALVTFYGVSFEDVKCKKWISSMIISFLTSIFLTQPIKVFLVALTLALLFKKADMEEDGVEDEEDLELQNDQTWLHQYPGPHEYVTSHRKLAYKPPDPNILKKAREQRLKELKMYDILREILFYSFFLWILLVVSYSFRDPNAYHMKKSLDSVFVDRGLGKVHIVSTPDNDFRKIVTRKNFFNWLKDVHATSLRAAEWYNNDQPFYQRGMATDRVSRIMGFATLRQLRVKRNLCMTLKDLRDTTQKCNKPYSLLDEDEEDYAIKWKPIQENTPMNHSKPEFTYRTGSEIDTYPYWGKHGFYSGGGYVVEMSGSLKKVVEKVDELMEDEWVDKYTRAVFVEFTVYNAQVNLFGVVTMLAEFLHSGGIATSHRIEPMNLLGYSSSVDAFQIACQITYLVFILFFIIKEIRNMYKQRKSYIKQFWNWVEICIIVLSISCVVVYFYRLYHAEKLTDHFKETHGNAYMKFQYTAYWNEVLLYFMGMLCFLASIKFIRLLRFNRRMGMLASTLSYGAKPLFLFLIMFVIMFMAYAQFFYLIYYIRIDNFRTLLHTMQTLLQMLVGKFNFNAMQSADPVMGPLVFSFYVVTVYYILINMFLTILNESFAAVRADIAKQSNEHEMVEFIIQRFRQWTGLNSLLGGNKKMEELKKPTVEEQMEAFPEKIDRLLDVLCHAYLNSDHFDAMFDSSSPEGKLAMKNLMKADKTGKSLAPPSYTTLPTQARNSLAPPSYTTLQVQPAVATEYGSTHFSMLGARPKTKY